MLFVHSAQKWVSSVNPRLHAPATWLPKSMARPLRGGGVGGFRQRVWNFKDADRTLGADGGQCRHRPCPPAEMSAQAKQRNMTQEVTAMARHVSQSMFGKKWSRPICGPSPTVTIFGLELSPQLVGPGVTPRP